MMSAIAMQELALHCGVPNSAGEVEFSKVSTDSRTIETGDLFFAIKGENFDGHDFLEKVAQSGACAAVVSEVRPDVQLPQLLVKDTLQALGDIGRLNREKFQKPVVGITGSCGKTTVKEMVAAILSVNSKVLATRGNLNNHIGVPLTLLELSPEHDYAVIEMGASALGEIDYLADIAEPTVAVVTNIAPAHIEGFGSLPNVARAKGEIYLKLASGGCAVMNLDEAFSGLWLEQNKSKKILTFSAAKPASVEANNIQEHPSGYISFDLSTLEDSVGIILPMMGVHNVMNALAAASCCIALGISLQQIQQGLENMSGISARMQIKKGMKASKIIDDTYNANPMAVKAAIDVLSSQQGIKILVLGDMGELGESAEEMHGEVGDYAKTKDIHMLLTTGELSSFASQSFNGLREGKHFANKSELLEFCKKVADKDVVFLCKGSRSARMEEIVIALMENEIAGDNR